MSWLIVGLGNPGPQYEGNRHNIGFLVADELNRRAAGSFRNKFHGNHAKIRIGNEDAHLLEPTTYMNRSGISVGAAASFFKAEPSRTVVIHDELDIPHGEVRIKVGGGHGGHNGLRSIFEHFGRDFVRVRCGIGRPPHGDVSGFVLSDFNADQRATLTTFVDRAADAVESVLRDGPLHTMNAFHKKAAPN